MSRILQAGIALSTFVGLALSDVPWSTDTDAYNSLAYGLVPNQTFRSSPIIAPIFHVNTFEEAEVDEAPYLFFGWGIDEVFSPMIFRSDDLSLVYADPQYEWVDDVRIQTVFGKPALTFWEGVLESSYGNGHALVCNSSYSVVSDIIPVDLATGILTDIHEVQVTDDGTVIIAIYEVVSDVDLTSAGGPTNGSLLDQLFQEIDPGSGELLFEWRVSDHVDVADTTIYYDAATDVDGYDAAHLNSIAKNGDDYLVNLRHTGSVYLVNGTDGSIIWVMGGKQNMFEDLSDGNALNFDLEHNPRLVGNHLTMFDNHVASQMIGCTENCSRGLHLELDFEAMTAEVVDEYSHPQGVASSSQGGYFPLSNDNVLVGWGSQPTITEHKGDQVVMDIQVGPILDQYLAGANSIYRAVKMEWEGYPTWDPSIAAEGDTVYVSWNGATEVSHWAVATSDDLDDLSGEVDGTHVSERMGFETAMTVDEGLMTYVRAAAIDSNGEVLGSTVVLDVETGEEVELDEEITFVGL